MLALFLYGVLGLFVGAAVNRAADNLPPPGRRSLLAAPRCAYCDAAREPVEQIGVLSALLLRGRCHACHAPLPLRAPLAEIGCALLFAFLWDRLGPGPLLAVESFFTAILLLIAIVDLEQRLILNVVVLPATVVALLVSPITLANQMGLFGSAPLRLVLAAVSGALTGYLVTLGIYGLGGLFGWLVARARNSTLNEVAFGLGDVKLAGLVGALVGFPAIAFALVYTILLGGVGAAAYVAFRLVARRGYSAFMAIPYGPFFVVTGWAFMLWGGPIVNRLLFGA
jgi:leader peptidase (prepilin peptidase)/N-methyltransferase